MTGASDPNKLSVTWPVPIADETHPCAYTGEPCDVCGCVDECMGQGVGYYDRRAIAEGKLVRID